MIKNAVKQICSLQGRQLYELANDLKITRQTLHRFLTGAPTLATVEKIANALQVPPFILLHPAPLAALREWNSRQDHTGPAASVPAVCPVCRSPLLLSIQPAEEGRAPSNSRPGHNHQSNDGQTDDGQTNGPKEEGRPEEIKLFED